MCLHTQFTTGRRIYKNVRERERERETERDRERESTTCTTGRRSDRSRHQRQIFIFGVFIFYLFLFLFYFFQINHTKQTTTILVFFLCTRMRTQSYDGVKEWTEEATMPEDLRREGTSLIAFQVCKKKGKKSIKRRKKDLPREGTSLIAFQVCSYSSYNLQTWKATHIICAIG